MHFNWTNFNKLPFCNSPIHHTSPPNVLINDKDLSIYKGFLSPPSLTTMSLSHACIPEYLLQYNLSLPDNYVISHACILSIYYSAMFLPSLTTYACIPEYLLQSNVPSLPYNYGISHACIPEYLLHSYVPSLPDSLCLYSWVFTASNILYLHNGFTFCGNPLLILQLRSLPRIKGYANGKNYYFP